MSVNGVPGDTRSVTSSARRRQIIDAAIAVIAESGYARASFARIAERAGLSSTRFISYHFKGKSDLVAAVVQDVTTGIGLYVGERVQAETTAAGMLRSYIEAVVGYIDEHRAPMVALTEVMLNADAYDVIEGDEAAIGHLEAILREGQESGEFRDFDPVVMATAVQRSVDGLPFALRMNPDMDLGNYAAELVTLFSLGTEMRSR